MDIRKIEYFLCVVEEESFTKAARRLHVSQSGISQQIASLEEELEVILINRLKNRFELTEAGMYLYQAGSDIINQYHFITKKTREIHYRSQLDIYVCQPGSVIFWRLCQGHCHRQTVGEPCRFTPHFGREPRKRSRSLK